MIRHAVDRLAGARHPSQLPSAASRDSFTEKFAEVEWSALRVASAVRDLLESALSLAAHEAEASLGDDTWSSARDWIKLRLADPTRPLRVFRLALLSRRVWFNYKRMILRQDVDPDDMRGWKRFAVGDLRHACDWLLAFPDPSDYRVEAYRDDWRAVRREATRRMFGRRVKLRRDRGGADVALGAAGAGRRHRPPGAVSGPPRREPRAGALRGSPRRNIHPRPDRPDVGRAARSRPARRDAAGTLRSRDIAVLMTGCAGTPEMSASAPATPTNHPDRGTPHVEPTAPEWDLSVAAASRLASVDPATLLRWIRTGILAPHGGRVRLAARRQGGRWRTDAAALDAFCSRLTAGPTADAGDAS